VSTAQRECVIVIPEAGAFGGAERSALALSLWLHRQAIPHRFLMYYDRLGLAKYADHPVQVTALDPPPTAMKKIGALRRYFAALPPGAPRPLMSGYQAALHASIAGLGGFHTLMHDTPVLFSDGGRANGAAAWLRQAASDRMLRKGLRSGGRTIVASEFLKADTERLYGGEIVIVRPGGMKDREEFRPRVADSTLRMLSVSRVEANKRIDWMLRALAGLERADPPLSQTVDWRLDVVGGGALIEPLQAMSRELGIAGRVRFHGFVDDAQRAGFFDQAHLFLMPSRQGYGLPAIEALYRGIPVLLHRESGVSDILLDTPWCAVIEGGEPNMRSGLAKMIHSLLAQRHVGANLPAIPTQAEWAEEVARCCGWLPEGVE
jgi:glycosyltransferase involved in cell wall biosynthesis